VLLRCCIFIISETLLMVLTNHVVFAISRVTVLQIWYYRYCAADIVLQILCYIFVARGHAANNKECVKIVIFRRSSKRYQPFAFCKSMSISYYYIVFTEFVVFKVYKYIVLEL